jgi:hypothetical protein
MTMAATQAEQGRDGPPIGRRRLLGMAGGLAAGALAPRLAAAQTWTATSVSQAAQEARRDVGRLSLRADNLLRLTVADGPERGAAAVRRFRAEQIGLARDLATVFNSRVSEDDWLLVTPVRELDLALAMRPLVIRLAPTADEVEAAIKQPLPQIEPLAGDNAEDVLLSMVLSTLGLPRHVALFEQLRNDRGIASAAEGTAKALKSERYGLAALELERLMRTMVLPDTVAALAYDLGKDATTKLYKALVVRFVPFVGWTYFVTLLLATIYYNRDTSAPVLR